MYHNCLILSLPKLFNDKTYCLILDKLKVCLSHVQSTYPVTDLL